MQNVTQNASPLHAVDDVAAHDIAALRRRLERLRRLAWWLNSAGRIPGLRTRFGLDTVLGLIPGGGDLISAALSLYIVFEGHRLGVPRTVVLRMLGNVAIAGGIGIVPLLGDLFDTVFKADLRNLALMETALARRGVRDGISDPASRAGFPR